MKYFIFFFFSLFFLIGMKKENTNIKSENIVVKIKHKKRTFKAFKSVFYSSFKDPTLFSSLYILSKDKKENYLRIEINDDIFLNNFRQKFFMTNSFKPASLFFFTKNDEHFNNIFCEETKGEIILSHFTITERDTLVSGEFNGILCSKKNGKKMKISGEFQNIKVVDNFIVIDD